MSLRSFAYRYWHRWFPLIILPIGLYVGALYVAWMEFLHTPIIPLSHSVDYVLNPGSSIGTVAWDLHTQGLLPEPLYFMLLARLRGDASHLYAGEYRFPPGATPVQILEQMVEGRILLRDFVVIEGSTFSQFLQELNNNDHITHTIKGATPKEVMAKLGLSGIKPEGLFFPDTYRYSAGTKDTTILKRAYDLMHQHLQAEWEKRAPNLPYKSSYQALIVASIIEKEAAISTDRPRIAGVILTRLKRKMPLQMDSTVIYALGTNYKGRLTFNDLKYPSPYNTYLNMGLPPTPIALPGLASIRAALHPVFGSLYFVATGDGSGGHTFSSTFRAHTQAVEQYRARQRGQ